MVYPTLKKSFSPNVRMILQRVPLALVLIIKRGLSVTLSEPACLQPVSLCQRSSSKRDGLSNTSSKQVQRSPHQLKACQVVRHESLCRPLSNPLTEKCTPSVVLLMRNRMWEQFRTPLKS